MITNNKFILLNKSLEAVSKGDINILTLVGSPGTGKTHTTLEYLRGKNINYAYINSYATPLSFYEILYENRNKDVLVFDDIHGVNNPLVLSMLKSACWVSDDKKIVSYYSTSSKMDLRDLPERFEFNANVVLIFNKLIQGYEPMVNRGITINFDFNFEEKLKIFEEVKGNASIDEDVLKFVKDTCNSATTNLSIRTLVILSKLKRSGQDFKLYTKSSEILSVDEDKELLIKLSAQEWSDATGHHKRTYYRKKKRL